MTAFPTTATTPEPTSLRSILEPDRTPFSLITATAADNWPLSSARWRTSSDGYMGRCGWRQLVLASKAWGSLYEPYAHPHGCDFNDLRLWVVSGHDRINLRCLLYPRKQTSVQRTDLISFKSSIHVPQLHGRMLASFPGLAEAKLWRAPSGWVGRNLRPTNHIAQN